MANVSYLPGVDITLSDADILVNTVNCVGAMGKGIALDFKNRFGQTVMVPYSLSCKTKRIKPGSTTLFPLSNGRLWAAMATKNHWYNPSQLPWIVSALDQLAAEAKKAGAKSIALPPPGCGNGGLDWKIVEPIVLEKLSFIERLDIHARSTIAR